MISRMLAGRVRGGLFFAASLLLVLAPTSTGVAKPISPDTGSAESLRSELQRAAGGRARIAVTPANGQVTYMGGSRAHPLSAPDGQEPSRNARDFIDHYGPLLGVANPSTDLTELTVFNADAGNTAVRYQQRYRNVPVFAGEIAVQVGANGAVLSTSGEALQDINVDTSPGVPALAAADLARNLTAKYDGVAGNSLAVSTPELWIYDPSLIGADDQLGMRLVWRFDVRTELGDVDRLVLIDARSGEVALQFSQRHDALDRRVCDNNSSSLLPCTSPVRSEGGVAVAGPADVNSAYDLSGVAYDFYAGLGRDSTDNAGASLISTVRYCPPAPAGCPFQNAFWNGEQMVYGAGFAGADDVVAHELTHAVTASTSKLLYYGESGAINESMSDVMGEFADLGSTVSGPDPPSDRWLIGEQLPGGAGRSMLNPPQFGDPDRMTSPLYVGTKADSHGVHTNSGVNNKAAFLIADGGSFNGQTISGIGTTKAAKIYYEAETTLLGPGSDYLDLFHILPQACTNLVGSAGITADDCSQVTKAVTATEMDRFPTTPGSHRSAPVCDGSTVLKDTLFN
ncbi:MAG: bacillolysin, partial [Ilumatobacteraceae bacterium]